MGGDCIGIGKPLVNVADCKNAATILAKQFGATEDVANFPKGCYVCTDCDGRHNDKVYWNEHETGKNYVKVKTICSGASKNFILRNVSINMHYTII